jgi:VWFA-related protein
VTRLLACISLCGLLLAQQQQPPQQEQPPQTFRTTVENVLAPVTVYDRANNYVHGLTPGQFQIFDNGKPQTIQSVEVTYTPISLVLAIQANDRADKILPQVNRIGVMLKPILLGDQGEAAVVAFDARLRTIQDFTPDADKITKAVRSITAGSSRSRLVDAVEESVHMLKTRNKDRRRLLLVIGETHDFGSEARGRETLIGLQLANITAYWVDMSHLLGTLTAPTPYPRADNTPPAAYPLPGGVPSTPNTVQQAYGTNGSRAEFLPLMIEIFKDVKNIFKTSPAELFTRGTGGSEYSFYSQRGLEAAIQEISDQLHSQYIVSYVPNNRDEGGFHQIEVSVIGHDYRCDTKPGYWVSPKP